jgi:hypothetical protein
LLIPGASEYQRGLKTKYLVSATDEYNRLFVKDKDLGFKPQPGYQWTVNKSRYDFLNGGNPKKAIFVKLEKIIPPEEQEGTKI